MENENNNVNKEKQKVVILIGLVTLLIAVLGATYAYFQISTDTESSNTNITGSTPDKSLVTLKQGTSNLHLNISASDMSVANKEKEYYGTDDDKPYVETEDLGTKTIASVELTGGEATTKYSCTAKLTVSKVTNPEEEADTMIDVLHSGDMILQFKGNIISEKLDLSELKENNPKEYNLSFKVTGNKEEAIQAYIKLLNKNENQNYLAGNKLNINISTSDLKCEVYQENKNVAYVREKSNCLTDDLVYGLYRCQGNSIVTKINKNDRGTVESVDRSDTVNNNFICLGNDCSTAESNDMYRIIGVTETGEIKVIKSTPSNDRTTWNNGDGDIQWPDSSIFNYLNTEFYQALPVELKEKIVNTTWYYGNIIGINVNHKENDQNIFTPEELAKYKELNDAIHGNDGSELNDEQKQDKIKEISKLESEALMKKEAQLTDYKEANIGLMNITDYCSSFESNGTLNCKTSGYTYNLTEVENEDFGLTWLTTKKGLPRDLLIQRNGRGSYFFVWTVYDSGIVGEGNRMFENYSYNSVRPVFFLTSDIELSGEGTIDSPFTIGIE